jgi:hypothetical protein
VRKDGAGVQTSGHVRHGLEAIHGNHTDQRKTSVSIRRTSQNPIDMGVLRSQEVRNPGCDARRTTQSHLRAEYDDAPTALPGNARIPKPWTRLYTCAKRPQRGCNQKNGPRELRQPFAGNLITKYKGLLIHQSLNQSATVQCFEACASVLGE